MKPSLRISPADAAQLAAGPDAPILAWFAGDNEALQVATSTIGLGIDLTGEVARIVGSRSEFQRLLGSLREVDAHAASHLERFLNPVASWALRSRKLDLNRPIIMGILNLTEDSFSGDGVGTDIASALQGAEALRVAGADVIDVGAETARADRPVLDAEAEARLVHSVVDALSREGHVVSSDTYKGEVARSALEAGAEIINDISGLTLGSAAAEEAARAGAGYVLNYSFSVPKKRPATPPVYDDVVIETVGWMEQRIGELERAGLKRDSIAIDPGIAFGKSHDEDIQMLRRIGELQTFGQPVLLAHSRKNFIGSVNGQAPAERDLETHIASAMAFEQGVRIFRVHDPKGARRALELAAAISAAGPGQFAPAINSWPWRAGASATHMTTEAPDKPAPSGQRW